MINNFVVFAHLRDECSDEFCLRQAYFYKNCGCAYFNNCFLYHEKYSQFKCFILENSLMHTCQIYIYSTHITFLFFCFRCESMLMLGTYINCYIIFSYVIPFGLFMWPKYILSLNSSLLFLTIDIFKTFLASSRFNGTSV